MKLTKIVATLGPVTESPETIAQLIEAGVNIFRFNFKHSEVPWHEERMLRVREVAEKMGVHTGILLDLQGPEIRLLTGGDPVPLVTGQLIELAPSLTAWTGNAITITHPEVIAHLHDGQLAVAADGKYRFTLTKKDGKTFLNPHQDGELGNRKTLNLPGADFPMPVLIQRDMDGIDLAQRVGADFVALSFVRTAHDVQTLKAELSKRDFHPMVVAKIETQKGITNLDEIMAVTDAVMVARGDMGVELSYEEVPYYTRLIIAKAIENNKPVITATQMLETMIDNPFPTRAEVSDIATATYDGTDAVMLSGETAYGKYPLEAVSTMARTAQFNEVRQIKDIRTQYKHHSANQTDRLSATAYDLYRAMHPNGDLAAIVVFSHSGQTARTLSTYRPKVPIISLCPNPQVARKLAISFGVVSLVEPSQQPDATQVDHLQVRSTIDWLITSGLLAKGQKCIVLHGDMWAVDGGISTVKVVTC